VEVRAVRAQTREGLVSRNRSRRLTSCRVWNSLNEPCDISEFRDREFLWTQKIPSQNSLRKLPLAICLAPHCLYLLFFFFFFLCQKQPSWWSVPVARLEWCKLGHTMTDHITSFPLSSGLLRQNANLPIPIHKPMVDDIKGRKAQTKIERRLSGPRWSELKSDASSSGRLMIRAQCDGTVSHWARWTDRAERNQLVTARSGEERGKRFL
jgi:hypothetical protein